MRLAAPLLIAAVLALLAGCGDSSSDETSSGASEASTSTAPAGASARACPVGDPEVVALRATGAGCAEAREVMSGWRRARECAPQGGASRAGCSLRSYRCQATATGRGWSVSCAKPGRSIAFTVRRG
ncbi:MAG TPA: hypothetical protein VGV69_02925 [Solirubrobacterales bacterium]|nr:hypothetical protein [Solirubrobacterales bacterium]